MSPVTSPMGLRAAELCIKQFQSHRTAESSSIGCHPPDQAASQEIRTEVLYQQEHSPIMSSAAYLCLFLFQYLFYYLRTNRGKPVNNYFTKKLQNMRFLSNQRLFQTLTVLSEFSLWVSSICETLDHIQKSMKVFTDAETLWNIYVGWPHEADILQAPFTWLSELEIELSTHCLRPKSSFCGFHHFQLACKELPL